MRRDRNDFSDLNRDPPRLDGSSSRAARDPGLEKPERDLKRSVLILGLGLLSWVATYVGMLELIEANMGDLPLVHRVIIGFSVAMLMTMIIWLLDQLFKPHAFMTKAFYAFGYVFLSIISVGFGFGFYWKVLESHGEASRSAESAVSQVQGALHAASTRLDQLQATLVQLTQVSTEKSEVERAKGGSCPNSKPGDGPRRKLREEDAQRFQFSSEFVKGRAAQVKGDMGALDGDLAKIVSNDISTIDLKSGTRNEFMRALSRKLDLTVTGFNAFRTDPQLKQMRTDLADRAERTTFADSRGGTFSCPDSQLQTALRGVVKAIDQLPELEKPQIAAVEGSEATIEAFRRLTTTFYGLLAFKMPPSADDMRDLQKKAVQSVESPTASTAHKLSAEQSGLSKRDYVPLAVALFVDLCLFLVSMVQAPASRLSGLMTKMKEAERGPVIEILSRFKDIHRDEEIRENFEIFRHVVFDMNGDYYVAVPLDAPPRLDPVEREALRVEAQLLANLFASFEKERIFKRTLLPTKGSIQKRLRRQGSKFAEAEAFRIYKFANGAWSDIILGAIMGAARRAENETRVFPKPANSNRPPVIDGNAQPGALPTAAHPSLANGGPNPVSHAPVSHAAHLPPRPQRPAPSMSAPPARPADPRHVARFGPYASNYPDRPAGEAVAPPPPRLTRPGPPHPEAAVNVKSVATTPVARAEPPPLPERNSPVVVPMPRPAAEISQGRSAALAPAEPVKAGAPAIDVTLARETATFSVPASSGILPPSLKAALTKAGLAKQEAAPARPQEANVTQVEEVLLALEEIDETETEIKPEPFSDRDLALISRMAPTAAE